MQQQECFKNYNNFRFSCINALIDFSGFIMTITLPYIDTQTHSQNIELNLSINNIYIYIFFCQTLININKSIV